MASLGFVEQVPDERGAGDEHEAGVGEVGLDVALFVSAECVTDAVGVAGVAVDLVEGVEQRAMMPPSPRLMRPRALPSVADSEPVTCRAAASTARMDSSMDLRKLGLSRTPRSASAERR